MALGSVHPAAESWARWPQPQHSSPDFNMLPTTMVSYDCRTTTTTAPPLPRPELAHSFLPVTFSQAPIPTPTTPQFPSVPYGGYSTYSPPPPPMMNECVDRVQPHLASPTDRTEARGDRSPSVKSEAHSAGPSSPSLKTEVVDTPQAVPPVQFNTAIDKLVREIKANPEIFGSADEHKPASSTVDSEEKNTQVC
ncbi:hypothetical protein VTJ49DRAFT_5893 [Mycothermus thermophilus]|uniref:Ataxin-2 C-terminal domain-containing protein n=1 Tax=Humicola insolens TaxID=85995 RepID=A0ABR3V2U0_HUMIN